MFQTNFLGLLCNDNALVKCGNILEIEFHIPDNSHPVGCSFALGTGRIVCTNPDKFIGARFEGLKEMCRGSCPGISEPVGC